MNFSVEDFMMPSICLAAFCIGFVLKKWLPTDDRIIPTVLAVFGIISGFVVFGFNWNGFVCGLFSALASVGVHQAFHQYSKSLMGEDELYAMGAGVDGEEGYDE